MNSEHGELARPSAASVEQVFREQYGRAVAVLVRALGSIELAEDAVQDAFTEALRRWPATGVPPSPVGWIITTARNRAIDRHRRERSRLERHMQASLVSESAAPAADIELEPDPQEIRDDTLRLLFTCCHPALNPDAQVELTLQLVGGLRTGEIARAFLVSETTMAQRLVRAKAKIRNARIPYRTPQGSELLPRVAGVMAVVYLIFNEGYTASAGADLLRTGLCTEAIRLARLLNELMPDEAEPLGLLALLLLSDARREARVDAHGRLVALAEQDRNRWNRSQIEEGHALVRRCLQIGNPGRFQIQAAINAVHTAAPTAADTDWQQVLTLYDQLTAIDPGPVVALNRAVAVAEVDGAAAGLAAVDAVSALHHYGLFHAIRADLLTRQGRTHEAISEYTEAIALTSNEAERDHLRRRRSETQV
jgi:RNA polymerase sigma-70 factor, ECF subfamily